MLEVIPFSWTHIEWDRFVSAVSGFLGRTPTRTLDQADYKLGDYKSFLVLVNDLLRPGTRIDEAMQTCQEAMRHLTFSFLVCGDLEDLADIISRSNKSLLVAKSSSQYKTAIVTASLWEWVVGIQSYCSDLTASKEARRFYNTVLVYFQQIGLSDLWNLKSKTIQPDGTFTLEEIR